MYIIRADGNAQIGAGHLMRCLTIAEALTKMTGTKGNILFLCADKASAELTESRGYKARSMGTDYRDMEGELPFWQVFFAEYHNAKSVDGGTGKDKETGKTAGTGNDTILVDSYYVTKRYLEAIGQYGYLFLMDDMQKQAYPVDAVINYNVFAKPEWYRQLYGDGRVSFFLGGSYVPVRAQFLETAYQVRDSVKHILLTTGGGDSENIAGSILQKIYDRQYEYHLVTGRFNPHLEELKQLAGQCGNLHLYHDVEDMAALMSGCDLAVTAGGTTIYELAAVGVPFICFSYAVNQELLTQYMGERDVAGFAGAYHKNPEAVLQEIGLQVKALAEEKEKRMHFHNREKKLIDGRGAERLAEMLIAAADKKEKTAGR